MRKVAKNSGWREVTRHIYIYIGLSGPRSRDGKSRRRRGCWSHLGVCLIVGFAREETDCGEETLRTMGVLRG